MSKPPKTAPPKAEFEGLYDDMCCEDCNGDRCVISGMNYCAHPLKGGLQSVGLNDPVAVARFNRAKAELRRQQGEAAARRALGGGYFGR